MSYLMENGDENIRLALKTNPDVVKRQAAWAGIGPGMRVLDVGCGSGVTTMALAELVGQHGHVVGLDISEERIQGAKDNSKGYSNISFVRHDIRQPYQGPVPFDAVWARFILEYFRKEQREIVINFVRSLRVGGIVVLADSDNNSMGHYGHSDRLHQTMIDFMGRLERDFNFDAFAGRKLYRHLYELGFANISCMMEPHHLIYGPLGESDAYNWMRKIELTAEQSGCQFEAYAGKEFSHYPNRYKAFEAEFENYFTDPARFCYTPLMIVRGEKKLRVVGR